MYEDKNNVFLTDAEKDMILRYVKHDGIVTLTKEEIRKLFYEIEYLKQKALK